MSGVLVTDHDARVSRADYKHHISAKRAGVNVLCLSPKIKSHYAAAGIPEKHLHIIPNGVAVSDYNFTEQPKHPDKSICVGLIDKRKRQYAIAGIPDIDFVGPMHEPVEFRPDAYLGEWTRQQVCGNLTDYGNFVLLTAAEVAAPLVCLEALAAGLGLVVSGIAAENLDASLPFIDVIPDDKIHDPEFVAQVIAKNRNRSLPRRAEIRAYAQANFDTAQIVKTKYLPLLKSIADVK